MVKLLANSRGGFDTINVRGTRWKKKKRRGVDGGLLELPARSAPRHSPSGVHTCLHL